MEQNPNDISRKIITNTLVTRANDLQQKDASLSKFSFTISRLSSKYNFEQSSIGISNFSIQQSHQQLINHEDESILSGISPLMGNQYELTYIFNESVRKAPPGAELVLPAETIKIDTLTLDHSVTLRGIPGATLEVSNCISIENPGVSERTTVHLSQLSIVFNHKQHLDVSGMPAGALFVIDGTNCQLELSDCDIKSVTNEAHNLAFGEEAMTNDCLIDNVIEKSGKSGLVVKMVLDANTIIPNNTNSTVPTPRDSKSNAIIQLQGNDFQQNGMYGLNIQSESLAYFRLEVQITKNRIKQNKKEGLAIRNVGLISLLIKENDAINNTGTGCWLQKVSSYAGAPEQFCVSFNRFLDSYQGYGLYLNESICKLDNNECMRNSLDGIMVTSSTQNKTLEEQSQPERELQILRSTVCKNGENGITLLDYSKGPVLFSHCTVEDNFHNGLYLIHTNDTILRPVNGIVTIENCKINYNKQYGLSLSSVRCCVDETAIQHNLRGAIDLPEDEKQLLKLSEPQKVRQYIKGPIGGTWGTLYKEKKGC